MREAMREDFPALRVHRLDPAAPGPGGGQAGVEARLERLRIDDLSPGEVVIRVEYSDINYKDALAVSGAGRILRHFPLVAGIDLSGTVEHSASADHRRGDAVLVTGCGLSEVRDGGFAHYARVPADAVVALPPGLDARSAMALGTAGFAAALAIMRMQINGQTPALGPVLVTGATGGVGSLAIDMLGGLGYEVVALTGKRGAEGYLRGLGAREILWRDALHPGAQPLESARWGGAIDNLGGETLSWLLRTTRERGNVASVGLAAGATLQTSVMPFILRGVSLLGVNSASSPRDLRLEVWRRIAADLRPRHLPQLVTREIELSQVPAVAGEYLRGQVLGRTLVRIGAA